MESSHELMNQCIERLLLKIGSINQTYGPDNSPSAIEANPFLLWDHNARNPFIDHRRVFALCLCHYSEIIFQLKKQISPNPNQGNPSAFSELKEYFREKDIGVIIYTISENESFDPDRIDHPFMKHYKYENGYFCSRYEETDDIGPGDLHLRGRKKKQIEPSTVNKQTSWYSAYTSKGRFLSESVFVEQLLRPATNPSTTDVADFVCGFKDNIVNDERPLQFILRVLQMLAVCSDNVKLYRPNSNEIVLQCLHKYQYLRFQLMWNCLLILQPTNIIHFSNFIDACLNDAGRLLDTISYYDGDDNRSLQEYIGYTQSLKPFPVRMRNFIENTIEILSDEKHREEVIMAISKQRHSRYARIQECIVGIGSMLAKDEDDHREQNITAMEKNYGNSETLRKLKHLHRLYEVRYKPVLWPGLLNVRD